jgi:hypothetical protein
LLLLTQLSEAKDLEILAGNIGYAIGCQILGMCAIGETIGKLIGNFMSAGPSMFPGMVPAAPSTPAPATAPKPAS